ncbi:probable cytochrome P450 6a13 [Anoplophora glabripennis]|nr:probable cytochrome P450 6a13 [Anoplophora glabripennis]
MDVTIFIALVIVILPLTYIYLKKKYYTYWAKRGVPYIDPKFFYGDGMKILKGEISHAEQYLEFYKLFKARGVRHGGIYILFSPVYMPIDPELIRNFLQKDFDHFVNRGFYVNEEFDPLTGHLFNLEGAKWKNLRAKLTPTFTSGKMKMMFQTLKECSVGLEQLLHECSKTSDPLDVREIIARFTTDTIGSCAFGIECNSMKNPDAEFKKYGKRIFEVSNSNMLKQIIACFLPMSIVKRYFKFIDQEVETFFVNAVRDTLAYREKNNILRNDFLHLLTTLKNEGNESDSIENSKPFLSLNEITAQCFVFFAAGFETSSTTTTFALYELSVNPEIQEKLREEILFTLEKHGNEVTYESIGEMTYLEKVINEVLRKYPPVPILHRRSNKSYNVPDTNVVIEEKRPVHIPVIGLHYDPDYYPDPEVFDPERFNEENKAKRPAFTYLPFGDGPRICIGLRFGKLQTKLALITILRYYNVALNEKTKTPLQLDKTTFILSVEGGVWLNLLKL